MKELFTNQKDGKDTLININPGTAYIIPERFQEHKVVLRYSIENQGDDPSSLNKPKNIKNQNMPGRLPASMYGSLCKLSMEIPGIRAFRMSDQSDNAVTDFSKAVSGLLLIRDLLSNMDNISQTNLLDSIKKRGAGEPISPTREIINHLLDTNKNYTLFEDGNSRDADLGVMNRIYCNSVLPEVLDFYCKDKSKYAGQLGILGCQIKDPNICSRLRKSEKSDHSPDYDLVFYNRPYTLCRDAEPRFQQALDDNNLLVIGKKHPLLLVKFVGTLTALCLQDFETSDGRFFVEGNWYTPIDSYTTQVLKIDYLDYKGRVDPFAGTWELMRPLDKNNSRCSVDQMNEAKKKAQATPLNYNSDDLTSDRLLPIKPRS